jgi:hypothetical protein
MMAERGGEYGDFSEGYRSYEQSFEDDARPPKKPGFFQRWRERRDERRAATEAEFDREFDRILSKISEHGMASLTSKEKKHLTDGSERQRRRKH